ncbi:hypothetical protein WI460_12605 [Gemmatimonadota bacterium Y43]|uniref:hypothetical protein n=1 Tax=Gaopeijia maritima TaxID=3119007 RepID=UPI003277AD79
MRHDWLKLNNEPARTPYASKVAFLVGTGVELQVEGQASLIAEYSHPIKIRVARDQPRGRFAPFKKFVVDTVGFDSAATAEREGLRIALALLWAAISHRFPLYLDYETITPVRVYDRTAPQGGLTAHAHATVRRHLTLGSIIDEMNAVLRRSDSVEHGLILSMELFAGAQLEITERARFITLVSALEPLAAQENLPGEIDALVDRLLHEVAGTDLPEDRPGTPGRLKQSLLGRLRALKRESVRQAILRIVREALPGDQEALKAVDEAYGLRSDILHNGKTEPYLTHRSQALSRLIRRIYASRLGLELAVK